MEGRVRVSVVATGIEAEAFAAAKSDNVKLLHPRKQQAVPPSAPAPQMRRPETASAPGNPVHVQQDVLVRELSARADSRDMTRLSADEPIMLGGIDAPAISEPPPRPQHHMREGFRVPPPPKRGVFGGLFGRPKRPASVEPTFAPPRPRATAQVITRAQPPATPQPLPREQQPRTGLSAPAQQQRTVSAPQQDQPAEDLFAGQGEATDFEIPAFLRRHANSGQ
jgi:hypothetical protein